MGDPNALVKRILFKINRTYKVTDHLAQQRIITYKYKKNLSKEIENLAHCVKIIKSNRKNERYNNSYYLGFIQLKDYMKLSKVADILGAGPDAGQLNRSPVERKHMNNTDCAIEACEVRGRTEDIFNGISLPVCEADVGSTGEARRDHCTKCGKIVTPAKDTVTKQPEVQCSKCDNTGDGWKNGKWTSATLRAYSGDGVTVRYYNYADSEADIPSDIDSVRKGDLS